MPAELSSHNRGRQLALSLLGGIAFVACLARSAETNSPASAPRYETRAEHDPNGIGKFYMGREIAHVMGHQAADWLERPEREKEERPDLLMPALNLKPGDVVADIGAGTGYYTRRLAKLVAIPSPPAEGGEGQGEEGRQQSASKNSETRRASSPRPSPPFRMEEREMPRASERGVVYAVEIQQEMLDLLTNKMAELNIHNVKPVLGTITDPKLPRNSLDLILMVDVYHEFDHPFEMVEAMCRALRRGGRMAFVEFRAEDPKVPIKRIHKMTEAQVRKEMGVHPLEWVETIGTLPQQHVMVFRKKS